MIKAPMTAQSGSQYGPTWTHVFLLLRSLPYSKSDSFHCQEAAAQEDEFSVIEGQGDSYRFVGDVQCLVDDFLPIAL